MTEPDSHSADQPSIGAPDLGHEGETEPHPLAGEVGALLDEVDEIRRSTSDSFDLEAITRQAELLEQAHEALTVALDDVDRR